MKKCLFSISVMFFVLNLTACGTIAVDGETIRGAETTLWPDGHVSPIEIYDKAGVGMNESILGHSSMTLPAQDQTEVTEEMLTPTLLSSEEPTGTSTDMATFTPAAPTITTTTAPPTITGPPSFETAWIL